ncbi:ShKT domain-containing protein [Caenorhabditis elegans]|uniref:ShKT domain-containing protein n=1 Tax=Caenorhabditis elegans TaxID=6239 RepID=D5MCN7_CAEEL|nr:ShKT domain-containing protein [Caenorhabditis elegans]CCD72723.1 ShKT domain-containing protein [Caenorhabditis elegans]|eukprot:NP_001255258.1 Uncharacterized protein CELE_K08D10.13 [Caenorhabditis elegans]
MRFFLIITALYVLFGTNFAMSIPNFHPNEFESAQTTPSCHDNIDCHLWAGRGFCADPRITKEQKKEYCAKTCGLC